MDHLKSLESGLATDNTCDVCGSEVTLENKHHFGILVRAGEGTRIGTAGILVYRRACSAECKEAWWESHHLRQPFRIDDPATTDWYMCGRREEPEADGCFDVPAWSVLVATGEIIARAEGDTVVVSERDGAVRCRLTMPRRKDRCHLCHDTGIISAASPFYWSAPGRDGWQEHWVHLPFDGPFEVVLWDAPGRTDRQLFVPLGGTWAVGLDSDPVEAISRMPRQFYMPPERVIGRLRFENPVDFNAWWTSPITAAERAKGLAAVRGEEVPA